MSSKRDRGVIDLTSDEIDLTEGSTLKHMRMEKGSDPSSSSSMYSSSSSSSAAAQGEPASIANDPSLIDIDKLTLFGSHTSENLVDYIEAKIKKLQSESEVKKESKENIQKWISEARVKKVDNAVIEVIVTMNLIATTLKKLLHPSIKNIASFSFYWPAYQATECLPNSLLKDEIIKEWWGNWPSPGEARVGHWWWWFDAATKRQTQKGWKDIHAALHPPNDRVFNNFQSIVKLAWQE